MFALSGAAIALPGKNSVTKNDIKKNAVTKKAIKNGAVVDKKIADAAVTSAKIADAAVGTDKIADSAVTSAKLDQAERSQAFTAETHRRYRRRPAQRRWSARSRPQTRSW